MLLLMHFTADYNVLLTDKVAFLIGINYIVLPSVKINNWHMLYVILYV